MKYDFSLDACMDSVRFYVEELGCNPFEELGRSVVRADGDMLFNKTMIEAWKKYIKDHDLSWDIPDSNLKCRLKKIRNAS